MKFIIEERKNKSLKYTNPLKYAAEKAKRHQKGLGWFVKLDAGDVPVNNAIFNKGFADGSVGLVSNSSSAGDSSSGGLSVGEALEKLNEEDSKDLKEFKGILELNNIDYSHLNNKENIEKFLTSKELYECVKQFIKEDNFANSCRKVSEVICLLIPECNLFDEFALIRIHEGNIDFDIDSHVVVEYKDNLYDFTAKQYLPNINEVVVLKRKPDLKEVWSNDKGYFITKDMLLDDIYKLYNKG